MNKILFLDRDGVINEDFGYVGTIGNVKFVDGIFDVIRFYSERNYSVCIVTNQSGIGRGYFSLEAFHVVMDYIISEIKSRISVNVRYAYCPHIACDNCNCRKPKTGMFRQIAEWYQSIDFDNSILVGDKTSDILAGYRAGIGNLILLQSSSLNRIAHESLENEKIKFTTINSLHMLVKDQC